MGNEKSGVIITGTYGQVGKRLIGSLAPNGFCQEDEAGGLEQQDGRASLKNPQDRDEDDSHQEGTQPGSYEIRGIENPSGPAYAFAVTSNSTAAEGKFKTYPETGKKAYRQESHPYSLEPEDFRRRGVEKAKKKPT